MLRAAILRRRKYAANVVCKQVGAMGHLGGCGEASEGKAAVDCELQSVAGVRLDCKRSAHRGVGAAGVVWRWPTGAGV